MLPKPNKDRKILSNYRPISLLPSIGKLSEKLIASRLTKITEKLKILPPEQSGFCKAHAMTHQTTRVTEYILSGQNKSTKTYHKRRKRSVNESYTK